MTDRTLKKRINDNYKKYVLPSKEGKVYEATDKQREAARNLFKSWLEDKDPPTEYGYKRGAPIGSIPWAIIGPLGEEVHSGRWGVCLGGVYSSWPNTKSIPDGSVLFLLPRYVNRDGWKKSDVHSYVTWVAEESAFRDFFLPFDVKTMYEDGIPMRLDDVPRNGPLTASSHIRLTWDDHNMSYAQRVIEFKNEFDLGWAEACVMAFLINTRPSPDKGFNDFVVAALPQCHTLFGYNCADEMLSSYLKNEWSLARWDTIPFINEHQGSRGIGTEDANSEDYGGNGITTILEGSLKDLATKVYTRYGSLNEYPLTAVPAIMERIRKILA